MHINLVRSGKDSRYVKRLLRESFREAGKVRKRTLLNVSRWDEQTLRMLEDALKVRRRARDLVATEQAERLIADLIAANERQRPWQVLQILTHLFAQKKRGRSFVNGGSKNGLSRAGRSPNLPVA